MLNDSHLWCEDCEQSHAGDCPEHGPLFIVNDSPPQSRARFSLPSLLDLRPVDDTTQDLGVFTNTRLAHRTRFGPLEARRSRQSNAGGGESLGRVPFKVFREQQTPLVLSPVAEERRCHWMVLVRPALHAQELNLVAFQFRANIYFVTTRDIDPDTELKVWYSKEYAFSMGSRPFPKPTTGVEEAERAGSTSGRQLRPRLACPRCHSRFSSVLELEAHLCPALSDEPSGQRRQPRTPPVLAPSTSGPRRGRPRAEEVVRTRTAQRVAPHHEESEEPPDLPSADPGGDSPAEELAVPGPSGLSGSRGPTASSSTPRAHRCTVCEKSFSSPGKLFQHMYSHTGERPFACSECAKAFSSKFKLMRHLLIHSADRKHQCPFCERSFHRKDHLKNHSKVHNPDKKVYRCEKESCRKEYNSYLSFRKHVAVHAAEDGGLDCKICGRSFTSREEILYHLKVHAGSRTVKNPSEKKFQCDHCERRFFTRKDVKRHLVVHTGKRDFLCQFCPQRFGRKDHLVRHIKKSHGGRARARRDAPTTEYLPPSTSSQGAVPVAGPSGVQRRGRRSAPASANRPPLPPPPLLTPAPPLQQYPQQPPPPPYPDFKDFPDQEELGIKMEEDESQQSSPGTAGVDFNQLFQMAGESSGQVDLDQISLMEELSVEDENQLMQLMGQNPPAPAADLQPAPPPQQPSAEGDSLLATPPQHLPLPANPTPLPCFQHVFQQQQQPPPPQ